MMVFVMDLILWKYTPIAAIVVAGILDEILCGAGLHGLRFWMMLLALIVAAVSTLHNFASYGRIMKRVMVVICLFMAIFAWSEFDAGEDTVTPPSYNAGGYGYTYTGGSGYNGNSGGSSQISFGGGSTCYACSGSEKCHVCHGRGDRDCSGSYCISGQCRSCRGTGLYRSGGSYRTCLVCDGDGICNNCRGTGRQNCGICRGSGKCTHC